MPEHNVLAHHRAEVSCRALVGQFILKISKCMKVLQNLASSLLTFHLACLLACNFLSQCRALLVADGLATPLNQQVTAIVC